MSDSEHAEAEAEARDAEAEAEAQAAAEAEQVRATVEEDGARAEAAAAETPLQPAAASTTMFDVSALAAAFAQLSPRPSASLTIQPLDYDAADASTRQLHWRAMCDQLRNRGAVELVEFIEFRAGVPAETADAAASLTDATFDVTAWDLESGATVAKCETYANVPSKWREQDRIWYSAIRQAVAGGSWPDLFEEIPRKLASLSLVKIYHRMTGGPLAAKRSTIKQLLGLCDTKAGADPSTWSSSFKETIRNVNAHRITVADILDFALAEGIADFTLIKFDLDKKLTAQEFATRGKTEAQITEGTMRHNILATLLDITTQAEAAMESASGGSTAFTVTPTPHFDQAFPINTAGGDCSRCAGKHPSEKCFQTKHSATGKTIAGPAPWSYEKFLAEQKAKKRGDKGGDRSARLQAFHARVHAKDGKAKPSGFLATIISPLQPTTAIEVNTDNTMPASIADSVSYFGPCNELDAEIDRDVDADATDGAGGEVNLAPDLATDATTYVPALIARSVPHLDLNTEVNVDVEEWRVSATAPTSQSPSVHALTPNWMQQTIPPRPPARPSTRTEQAAVNTSERSHMPSLVDTWKPSSAHATSTCADVSDE
jgi:hypothetical protein